MAKLSREQTLFLYDGLIEGFIKSGAENYLCLQFSRGEEDLYEIIIQKSGALSIAEKNTKLEAEIERVKQVLYCLDGWYQDLMQENYGDAKGWLRHLEKAYSDYFNEELDGESPLAKRDLEQQAKGIDWVLACRELNLSEGEVHTLMYKCNQLRKQAKE